jgi:MGT family glycosyltransferase
MTHFGLICPTATGHINTIFPLGKELQRRGHHITVINIPYAETLATAAGFDFQIFGEVEWSNEIRAQLYAKLAQLSGKEALNFTFDMLKKKTAAALQEIPQIIKEARIEALIVDQTSFEGGTIAEYLDIPFITLCSALPFNQENNVPPFAVPWGYNLAWWAKLRNQLGYSQVNRFFKPTWEIVSEHRRQWNLPAYPDISDINYYDSKVAIISQQPIEFEFPRQKLPAHFHFTGPFHDSTGRKAVDFPFENLNDKPLIYASMGTLQNRLKYVFSYIAEACNGLDAQLVISLGGALEPEAIGNLPGNPLVVKYAPQLELLQKASLTITHSGLNTTLESLNNGVPMVAIPVTNDQPGVAARTAWSGAGEAIPLKKLTVSKLRESIKRVLTSDSYKQNALKLQTAIHNAGGVKRAADIIEKAVTTSKPVIVQR